MRVGRHVRRSATQPFSPCSLPRSWLWSCPGARLLGIARISGQRKTRGLTLGPGLLVCGWRDLQASIGFSSPYVTSPQTLQGSHPTNVAVAPIVLDRAAGYRLPIKASPRKVEQAASRVTANRTHHPTGLYCFSRNGFSFSYQLKPPQLSSEWQDNLWQSRLHLVTRADLRTWSNHPFCQQAGSLCLNPQSHS